MYVKKFEQRVVSVWHIKSNSSVQDRGNSRKDLFIFKKSTMKRQQTCPKKHYKKGGNGTTHQRSENKMKKKKKKYRQNYDNHTQKLKAN